MKPTDSNKPIDWRERLHSLPRGTESASPTPTVNQPRNSNDAPPSRLSDVFFLPIILFGVPALLFLILTRSLGEIFFFSLLYGGGLVFALLCMLVATFCRTRPSTLAVSVALSVFSLIAQSGCWGISSNLDRNLGGASYREAWTWEHTVSLAFGVWAVWAAVLLVTRAPRRGLGGNTNSK